MNCARTIIIFSTIVCCLSLAVYLGQRYISAGANIHSFTEARNILSQLQSSVLSENQLALLESEKSLSDQKLAEIDNEIRTAREAVHTLFLQANIANNREREIVNDFTLTVPSDYFFLHIDSMIQDLVQREKIKTLLTKIRERMDEKNSRIDYLKTLDEYSKNYCVTNDERNDIFLVGTVRFPLSKSPELTDICEKNTLVQYQCIRQYFLGVMKVPCSKGCQAGKCME